MSLKRISNQTINFWSLALISFALASCANDPAFTGGNSPDVTAQQTFAAGLTNVKISFNYNDYYTLSSPNAASCAGDAKTYYDAISGLPMQTDLTNAAATIHPAFIKNISVDLTDSNSTSTLNSAFHCSYGSGTSAPPTSSCATFDYGANGGVNSSLGGSILVLGGIENPLNFGISCSTVNGFFTNACPVSAYALSVDALPASSATNPANTLVPGLTSASGPISSWENLASGTSYAGPLGLAGASASYDNGTQKLAIFGGSTPVTGATGVSQAVYSDTTWTLGLNTQVWAATLSNPTVDTILQREFEQDLGGSRYLSKVVTGRANFGYTTLQGISLSSPSTNGQVNGVNGATVDATDRIVIAGGLDANGFTSDVHKFNPTFGPEIVDTIGRTRANGTSFTPAAGEVVQWLDNYTTQLMNNTTAPSLLKPLYPSSYPGPAPSPGIGFGLASIRNNSSATGSGYLMVMGGFDSHIAQSTGPESCNGSSCAMALASRFGTEAAESYTSNYSAIGNLLSATLTGPVSQLSPVTWNPYVAATGVPWFGGSSLLPGLSLANNDLVFFGGSTCTNYYQNIGQVGCLFNNPGTYFRMGSDPVATGYTLASVPSVAMSYTAPMVAPPARAGMNTARGLDDQGNIMIVAFGGNAGLDSGSDTNIYYMYGNGGTPTWTEATSGGGQILTTGPAVVTNGAMVYSHVTHKFYLFGGYASVGNIYSADTWELTVTSPSPTGCATNGTCQFSWRQLNIANGLVCSPNCPTARRNHRMLEANYFNRAPSIEPVCSPSAPCSFGIFMEGGTADGINPISDRWMFDPTANDGFGSWQQIHEMPSRALAAMTSVDYSLPSGGSTLHRAVLFGGETGFQNPTNAVAANTFVAPTLGDTWIYDYDAGSWNRVNLLGKGYYGAPVTGSEIENRQAFDATDTSAAGRRLAELTPPATSGAIMVTRTSTSTHTLAIPEVYFLGGRLKDGSFQSFDHVYKFCIASTGETYALSGGIWVRDPTNPNCDAYDAITNPVSPSPITNVSNGYTGRWLRKSPLSTTLNPSTSFAAYQGAGAYDPVDDIIAVYGGYKFIGANTAITDSGNRSLSQNIFEYTPPSAANNNGSWAEISTCGITTAPPGRWGHSLSYDSKNQQLVSVGGFDVNGNALIGSVNGQSFTTPDVWVAKRSVVSGTPCYTWRQITVFGNSLTSPTQAPPNYGLGNFPGIYIPSTGYNTGYYSMYDSECVGAGPIASGDPTVSKVLAGGVYIDIDRSQLGTYENVLLNLTFIPFSQNNLSVNSTLLTSADEANFKIHLISTGQSASVLQSDYQPRFLKYSDKATYPTIVDTLSVIAPATGQMRQEQVLIPLSTDPSIDRIRIERNTGSGILIDASIFRLGHN